MSTALALIAIAAVLWLSWLFTKWLGRQEWL